MRTRTCRAGLPGPVVALRADMDGLPVTERAEVPFRSTVTTEYRGEQVGAIKGGIRFNIIPDSVEMMGTIRTFDPKVREQVIANMRRTIEHVAAAHGATATLEILPDSIPVTVNDPDLTRRMLPVLATAVGRDNIVEVPLVTGAEDFSYFALEVPSVFVLVGSTAQGEDAAEAPANHSPLYFVDESSLDVGLRAILAMTLGYLREPEGRATTEDTEDTEDTETEMMGR